MNTYVNILSSVTNPLMGASREGLKGTCGDVRTLRVAGKPHHQTASCSVCSELWGCSKQSHNNTYGVRGLQILLNTKPKKTNNSNDDCNNYVSCCYYNNDYDNNHCVNNVVRSLSMCIPFFNLFKENKEIYRNIYGLGMNNGTENEKPAVILGSARVCTYKPHTSVNRVCEVSGTERGGDKCGISNGFITKATQAVSNALFRVRWTKYTFVGSNVLKTDLYSLESDFG